MPIIKSLYWEQTDREEHVYKFPFNNIATGNVLTVNESQEAFFFKSGVLCDSFTAVRHVLSTANLPLLQKVINLPSGGDTTFMGDRWSTYYRPLLSNSYQIICSWTIWFSHF